MRLDKARWLRWLGVEARPLSHRERGLSMLGGLLGIGLVFAMSPLYSLGTAEPLILGSIGASAVLVFAVPHGPLSQPWPVLGGQVVAALVGVSVAQLIPVDAWAGPLAVGLAILAMHYLRCLHPPGGATALAAVIGGEAITALGYSYVLLPVLSNVAILLLAGVAFNYPFPWRRYPSAWAQHRQPASVPPAEPSGASLEPGMGLNYGDLVYALGAVESFIDTSASDLLRIYGLAARHHAEASQLAPAAIEVGRCYSNGCFGPDWGVRCVERIESQADGDHIYYRGAAGNERVSRGIATRADFAEWARYPVERDENNWRPVGGEQASCSSASD